MKAMKALKAMKAMKEVWASRARKDCWYFLRQRERKKEKLKAMKAMKVVNHEVA